MADDTTPEPPAPEVPDEPENKPTDAVEPFDGVRFSNSVQTMAEEEEEEESPFRNMFMWNGDVVNEKDEPVTVDWNNGRYVIVLQPCSDETAIYNTFLAFDNLIDMPVDNLMNQPLTVTDREGNSTSYEYDAAGNLSATVDALGGKVSYSYDAQGRMVSMTDARGNSWSYAYDANGQMLSTTDPLGNTSTTAYDSMGRTTVSKNPRGAETAYSYDAAGRNTATTDALGHATRSEYDKNGNLVKSVDKNGNETVYEYDAENRLIKQTDALGQVTTYTYDALGRTIKTVSAAGAENTTVYDEVGRAVSSTDPKGNQTQNSYDVLGRLIKTVHADGTSVAYEYDANGLLTKSTDENGNSYTYTYNKNGNILTTTDPMGGVVTNEYDALGRVVKTTNQAGGVTQTAYDANGNISSTTDALGNVTSYEYDALNRVIATTDPRGGVTRSEYDANGNMIKATQPDGGVITYEYDLLDRLVKTTDAEGNVTAYSYDNNGNQTAVTDGRGNTKTSAYDALNRLTSVTNELGKVQSTVYDADGRIVKTVNERGAETSYEYDANGNILKLTDALGNSTTFSYDNMNRVIAMTDAKGAVTSYAYTPTGKVAREENALGKVTTYEYDALDRVVKVTDAEHVTSYEYDALGNATKTVSPSGAVTTLEYDALGRVVGSIDANHNKTSYVLDANGNVVQTIDALGNVAAYEYDAMNRLTKMTLHRVDGQNNVDEYEITLYTYDHNGLVTKTVNALGDEKLMVYDQNGNLVQQTDEDGNVTEYTYDATNLVTAINYADGKNAAFTYDETGNLVEMDDWNGKTTFALDLLDRITSFNDHNGKTVAYAYDEVGNQTSIAYPDGTTVAKEYDLLGQLVAVTDGDGAKTSYDYDIYGNNVKIVYPNKWIEETTFDAEGRELVVEDVDPFHNNKRSKKYEYKYDANGNLTCEYKREVGASKAPTTLNYTYDALNRLTSAKEPPSFWGNATANRSYQYDSLGNLVYEQDKGKQRVYYQYNNLNQLIHKTVCDLTSYVEDSHEYRYTYDKRGNLTLEENCERTTQGNKWITEATYTYNAANRLYIGTNAKGEKSVYTYNGLGQRVRNEYIVQDNGYDYTTFDCTPPSVEVDFETPEVIIRDFVIDQTSPIEEVLVESEKDGFDYRYTVGLDRISVNVLSPDPDTNHERTQTATKQWLHSDRLGSTVNSTDSFGRVTERTDYNEWGEITFHEKIQNVLGYRTINTDQTYTNHDYDVVLGLYYAKARMYDPRDKRFVAQDSALIGVNWYLYCQDNPLAYIDPSGNVYNLVQGTIAHLTIEQYIENIHDDVSSNVYIPNGGRGGGKGYVDVLRYNYPGSEIYEIKSISYYPNGYKKRIADTQLGCYIVAINNNANSGYHPAVRGESLLEELNGVALQHPLNPNKAIIIRTYMEERGMIYYEIVGKKMSSDVTVVAFSPEREKTLGYYEQVTCNDLTSEWPIDTYEDQDYWDAMSSWLSNATSTVFSYHKHTYIKITYPDGVKMVRHVGYTSEYPVNTIHPMYSNFDKYDIYYNYRSLGWQNAAKDQWDASETGSSGIDLPSTNPTPNPDTPPIIPAPTLPIVV